MVTVAPRDMEIASRLSEPLAEDNENNHGGIIVALAVFSLALVLGTFWVRLWASYTSRLSQSDDSTFVIGAVSMESICDSC